TDLRHSERRASDEPGTVQLRAMIAAARPRAEPATKTVGPTLPSSKPVSLDIPSIGVHTGLLHLGQTPGGALEVPAPGPHYDEAAWYRYSPTPGSLGPAILLGHVDSAVGGPSVFFRLGELRAGDRVSITRADDSIAVFIVDGVHRYAKDDFPTRLVYGNLDHAGLRLLTCGGPFDEVSGHYLDNIVVFASLVGT
ncbi:MAG: class F sortase, partial [Actinomycetota bacterium]